MRLVQDPCILGTLVWQHPVVGQQPQWAHGTVPNLPAVWHIYASAAVPSALLAHTLA
jgi:hypothetical protein